MADLKRDVAQEFLDANKTLDTEAFGITDSSGSDTGDEIFITIIRRKKKSKLVKLGQLVEKQSVSFHGPGQPCPTCGGSGRI